MAKIQKTITPVDGSVYVERELASETEINSTLEKAVRAQAEWKHIPIEERAALCSKAVDAFVAKKTDIAQELTWQMGRPVKYSPGEVGGFEERSRYMIKIAAKKLADIKVEPKEGFTRFIRREPLGVVFTVAPWNYPYLTAVNSVMPAIMVGNAVILKHSSQTPLCAERFDEAFKAAGLPEGVFQFLHLDHESVARVIKSPQTNFVAFTGSVPGGKSIEESAVGRFIGVGLELGGKDPAYVRPDVNLDHAVENLVDGAFFNSGQSCCGIERIYVHANVYDKFVKNFIDLVSQYKLGNPLDEETTLGPMVRTSAAEYMRKQIADAIRDGAETKIDPKLFPADKEGTPYLAPQVLLNVNHSMSVMSDESFGPVIGIMKVQSDEEAVQLMNDSEFGLTASIWTTDEDEAVKVGDRVETGTWFMNRCDYLDPALAWTGVKNSGRGCTLSEVGYEHLTRPKSYHLRTSV
ncbi:MAG: aldehyde dehydrogenase family protein [Actinobacteria bacterium]|nr:aldehyde dehydrogenase family protein [Actinomycetota bacterium]